MRTKWLLSAAHLLACTLAVQVFLSPGTAKAELSLQCSAMGMGNVIVMRARYDASDAGTRIFYTSFRAERSFGEGRKVTVFLAGTKVGKFKLQKMLGGDVGAELSLNDPYSPGVNAKRFRFDFPDIVRPGMNVAIKSGARTVLSCRFE